VEKCIAIDGPCGSGKSAIAKIVAEKLGTIYVDTGAMFRAVGFVCFQQKIPFKEGEQLTSFIEKLKLCYKKSDHESGVYIEIDGVDLTIAIRDHHVSELASKISKLPTVRTFLLNFQREIATKSICVMEGRDIGTVVFPKSFCKIYLTADSKIRATRRHLQLVEKGNCTMSYEEVLADVLSRDERDMSRKVAPLKQAEDAFLLDSSNLSLDEVVKQIVDVAIKKANEVSLIL
jgi:cytidylate kinase